MWFADWVAREKMVSVRKVISAILVGFFCGGWGGGGKAGRWFE